MGYEVRQRKCIVDKQSETWKGNYRAERLSFKKLLIRNFFEELIRIVTFFVPVQTESVILVN